MEDITFTSIDDGISKGILCEIARGLYQVSPLYTGDRKSPRLQQSNQENDDFLKLKIKLSQVIPFRVVDSRGKAYTTKTFSKDCVKMLKNYIREGGDIDKLVLATKRYYQLVTSPKTFSNFIVEGGLDLIDDILKEQGSTDNYHYAGKQI